ncbi:MAG: hypothetical protein PHP85_05340 [Gallionella sp.]|nr:hypothetical protein [Gallionella sp.]
MMPDDNLPSPAKFSLAGSFFFWIFWLSGAALCLLFGIFLFITATGASVVAVWNLLIVLAQCLLLTKSAHYFHTREKPVSELMLWAAFAGIAMPLIAFGGCAVINDMGNGVRFAG